MGRYIARRLLETIPLMFVISIFVFMFIHLLPGDPARTLAGVEATPEEIEAVREEFGLNDPLIVQYVDYIVGLFHGDMGRSLKSNIPVSELIWSRFQFTIQLVFAGLVWAPFLGIFIGVMCAIKRGTWADLGGMLLAICGLSAPGFWLGLMGIQFFSVKLGALPSAGLDSWKSLVLPSLVMGTGIMATLARYSRSSMLETLREDYVRTARAKGVHRYVPSCVQKLFDPGCHDPRLTDRRPLIRFRNYGDNFLHPGYGTSPCRLHRVPRLSGDPGVINDLCPSVCPH